MRARIEHDVVFLHQDDLPQYKKQGSIVRNNYFWALKAIAGNAPFGGDWEYEAEVWLALRRVLLAFSESGYLGLSETTLEFPVDQGEIPAEFRDIFTWQVEPDPQEEAPTDSHDDRELDFEDSDSASFEAAEADADAVSDRPAKQPWRKPSRKFNRSRPNPPRSRFR